MPIRRLRLGSRRPAVSGSWPACPASDAVAGLFFTTALTRAGTGDPSAFRAAMTAALIYEVAVFAIEAVMVPALPRTRAVQATPPSGADAAPTVGPAT